MPNRRRLQMHLSDAFRRAPGNSVIFAPAVAVFSEWAEQLVVRMDMLEGKATRGSIHAFELEQVWAWALGTEAGLLASGERRLAARQARSASRMLHHWWPDEPRPHLERAFWLAEQKVAEQLSTMEMRSPEAWLDELSRRLFSGRALPVTLPKQVQLDGFMEITPLENRVLEGLKHCAVTLELSLESDHEPGHPELISFSSGEEELAAAAYWARHQLQKGHSQVAVVINRLDTLAERARHVFENILCSDDRRNMQDPDDCPFYLAHSESLAVHPAIGDALLLLSLAITGFDHQQEFTALSRWLLSPFWAGSDTEHATRALLERRLRETGQYWRTPAELVRWAHREFGGWGLEALLACCSRVNEAAGRRGRGETEAFFFAVLQAWGWPGPLARGPVMCRLVKQFGKLLERLGGMECTSDAAGLDLLRQLCADTTVEPAGGPLSPVQVLSPEDAAGRCFESAWVLNLHDGNWPAHPGANPYLPLNAIHGIPRCTASGELDYCERLTRHLIRLAPSVCFSFSVQTDDIPNQASQTLISALDTTTPPREFGPVAGTALSRLVAPEAASLNGYSGHPWLAVVEDGLGLPLKATTKNQSPNQIPGGAGVLADQAACPLLGYVRHRLKARFEPMPGPFADAAYRGNLMHTAMHQLFAQHQGKPGLPDEHLVPGAVTAAMEKCRAAHRLLPVSFDAEVLRLDGLLRQWLHFERLREHFAVEWLEHDFSGELAGFPVSLRADRIDRLADGSLMIIDYKSSAGSIAGWAQDRLQLPQLPFYAVVLNGQQGRTVSAIALATVRSGECALKGICRDSFGAFSKVEAFDNRRGAIKQQFEDWNALMRHWRQAIDQLSLEIVQGVAVNCVHHPDAVAWSGLDVLLRRPEGEAWLAEHSGRRPPGELNG